MTTVVPYKDLDTTKKEQVALMFDKIAVKYDFLNHFLSMGIDRTWRTKTISELKDIRPATILDIATGTGDLAIEALKLNPSKVNGIDISEGMLAIGREKLKKKGLDSKIELSLGDSEQILFGDCSFDAATCAFGVRNFANLSKGLSEIYRILKPNGKVAILEFSKPKSFPFKQIYNFYFFKILPFWGRRFSKDNSAYTYLPESVQAFPDGKDFLAELEKVGFVSVKARVLTLGIASIYTAVKKA